MNEENNNEDCNKNNFISLNLTEQTVDEVIDEMVNEEVKRMRHNLTFIDTLETNLKEQIFYRLESGTLDLDTLQKVMDTMNKSVDRSNKIIKDKNSDLLNLIIDARNQNIIVNHEQPIIDSSNLPQRSRKKLTQLISKLLEEPDEEVTKDVTEDSDENN